MAIENIVAQLDAEIARLNEVRSLLAATGQLDTKLPKPRKAKVKKAAVKAPVKKRVLSPEARTRIAEAQKKRWEAARKAS